LSTTDHSSAMRMGLWSGSTTLPARSCTFFVMVATAALVSAGFGYKPPNAWKWRSGVQIAKNPWVSAKRAPSVSNR